MSPPYKIDKRRKEKVLRLALGVTLSSASNRLAFLVCLLFVLFSFYVLHPALSLYRGTISGSIVSRQSQVDHVYSIEREVKNRKKDKHISGKVVTKRERSDTV
jgi:hypothetical protein